MVSCNDILVRYHRDILAQAIEISRRSAGRRLCSAAQSRSRPEREKFSAASCGYTHDICQKFIRPDFQDNDFIYKKYVNCDYFRLR